MIRPNIVYVPLFYPFNNSLNNNNNILNNNHNIQLTQNNFNSRISIDNNIEKEEEKNIIKYSWLKKEKFTIEISNKKKDGYECSICLENIQLINDINILKCGHIFHYKCIENLVDHNKINAQIVDVILKQEKNNQLIKIHKIYYLMIFLKMIYYYLLTI